MRDGDGLDDEVVDRDPHSGCLVEVGAQFEQRRDVSSAAKVEMRRGLHTRDQIRCDRGTDPGVRSVDVTSTGTTVAVRPGRDGRFDVAPHDAIVRAGATQRLDRNAGVACQAACERAGEGPTCVRVDAAIECAAARTRRPGSPVESGECRVEVGDHLVGRGEQRDRRADLDLAALGDQGAQEHAVVLGLDVDRSLAVSTVASTRRR